MTREGFEKSISVFDDAEAFLCAAHVDGVLAIAVKGPIEAVIAGAIQIIVDKAERSDDTMDYLVLASGMLHSAMLSELRRKKEAQK